jgi:anionic cell wall polymer biosynthesis LytR-Cps2A-Psr (LCP) family protein
MVVLGLVDQLRQILQADAKKEIGRPKGSRSASKFDQFHDAIIKHLKAQKSVSEMSRIFGVSRSSLKDYIESRELKEVASGGYKMNLPENGAAHVINTIKCPVNGSEYPKESK